MTSVFDHPILAAIDLGSNSFRLKIVRVENNQLYTLDILRESIRLAAGLDENQQLDGASQQRALACLARFGERLHGLPKDAVRAVGTNALRLAKNSSKFLQQAETALGYPIEIIAGREEARLIYLGVAYSLPQIDGKRLVVDIGGGSTEFIIGQGVNPLNLESLNMGCVSHSLKFFPNGKITSTCNRQNMLRAMKSASSPTSLRTRIGMLLLVHRVARVLGEIFEQSGLTNGDASVVKGDINLAGLERLRELLLNAGDVTRLNLPGLKPERAPVLPGGLAIMLAAFRELGIARMQITSGALREGVLYDLLDRAHDQDMPDVTAHQMMQRYHVDAPQAARVERLAKHLAQQFLGEYTNQQSLRTLSWAASLHEMGLHIAY